VVKTNAENIEILAGAGQLDNARTLADRLLAFDNSEDARRAIQQHLNRAGQPGLLTAPKGGKP
jgi:hypothetical protein